MPRINLYLTPSSTPGIWRKHDRHRYPGVSETTWSMTVGLTFLSIYTKQLRINNKT